MACQPVLPMTIVSRFLIVPSWWPLKVYPSMFTVFFLIVVFRFLDESPIEVSASMISQQFSRAYLSSTTRWVLDCRLCLVNGQSKSTSCFIRESRCLWSCSSVCASEWSWTNECVLYAQSSVASLKWCRQYMKFYNCKLLKCTILFYCHKFHS